MSFQKYFNYTTDEIIKKLGSLRNLKVLVIGDTIIDQYHYCSSIGKSPKDNVMVVRYLSEETFAGGVLAAANHIAGFCDDVHLITCLGRQNSFDGFVKTHLKKNIIPRLFYRDDVATVVKRRFVEPTKLTKLFGISVLDDYSLPNEVDKQICECLEDTLKNYDLVVVTDYGHGFISRDMIRILCQKAKFLAVNVQTNTDNAGFNYVTKYPKADYICLDEPETRLACQDKYGKLEDLIKIISKMLQCDNVAVTHGQYDTTMYSKGRFYTIPVLSKEVKDTIGAGDAFFAITSLCVANKLPMDMTGLIGNSVGALKVRTVCNRSSVEPKTLYKFIGDMLQK